MLTHCSVCFRALVRTATKKKKVQLGDGREVRKRAALNCPGYPCSSCCVTVSAVVAEQSVGKTQWLEIGLLVVENTDSSEVKRFVNMSICTVLL